MNEVEYFIDENDARIFGRPGFGYGFGRPGLGFGRPGFGYGFGRPFGFYGGPFFGGLVGGLVGSALFNPYFYGGYPYPPYPYYY
ncbi:hypothetical protein QPL78_09390 [Bacillus halotolerans]|uniref:hypothetical protein n=1 Tax=Bacillus halotolerans TaxID=260554 RepID=UPI0025409411|nr:hypothetical protein [Bacillus halotolerans]WIG48696.1 hypothetical protein QPL78_09390 [Bacillus halotolerans]